MQQLLLIETVVKLAAGLVLVSVPVWTARVLGIDRPASGFWPRMLGGVLIGLAAATFIEERLPGSRGLALAGAVAINLSLAFVLIGSLIMKAGASTRRGRAVLWLAALLLLLVAFVEIAYA